MAEAVLASEVQLQAERYHRSMKALLLSEYSRLEVVDVPMPRPAADEVLVRVEACGICGSDVHGYDGSTGRRIPPVIMGHEAAGTVVAAGASAAPLKPGDRITFDSTVYCGECPYCRRGDVNLCDQRQVLGVSTPEYRRAGAFADFVTVPARIVHSLPPQLSFEHAAMIEPLAVALHAVKLSGVPAQATTLVVGAGMIGLLVVQALRESARAAGTSNRILVIDIDDSRLELARQLGAAEIINAKTSDAAKEVLRLTNGVGVDVALEAVGSSGTIKTAVECTRKGGAVTLIGNVSPTAEIPLQLVVSRQLRLQGSAASSGEYPECIDLLARGAIDVKPLITSVAPLADGPRWFERLHAREAHLMKVILTPAGQAEGDGCE